MSWKPRERAMTGAGGREVADDVVVALLSADEGEARVDLQVLQAMTAP